MVSNKPARHGINAVIPPRSPAVRCAIESPLLPAEKPHGDGIYRNGAFQTLIGQQRGSPEPLCSPCLLVSALSQERLYEGFLIIAVADVEPALAWRFAQDARVEKVSSLPNAGTATEAKCENVAH